MINKTVLEDLDAKISLILERYTLLKNENTSLKGNNNELQEEIESLNLLVAEKNQIIHRLKENDELKDLELEDIALRISHTIGIIQDKEEALA